MTDIDDIFEELAAEMKARADADDADPAVQARKAAQKQREIAQGIRDADGQFIISDEEETDEEANEEDGEEEE
jgi:hypothetical protein